MKKPSLIEEIKRFHEVSGNKNVISENFLDDLLKKVGLKGDEKNTKKVDDPKKADLVSDDVKQFFSTLENVKDNLNQQTAGNYEFQKEVESVQIALHHGAVNTAKTDIGYQISNEHVTTEIFAGHNITLLGDIHKPAQFLNEAKTIAYPGSLIQQNHVDLKIFYLLQYIRFCLNNFQFHVAN